MSQLCSLREDIGNHHMRDVGEVWMVLLWHDDKIRGFLSCPPIASCVFPKRAYNKHV